jgi:hypothetical protein
MTLHAQCHGAGLRICTNCLRWVENNPARSPYQTMVGPTTSARCANWKAIPASWPTAAEPRK